MKNQLRSSVDVAQELSVLISSVQLWYQWAINVLCPNHRAQNAENKNVQIRTGQSQGVSKTANGVGGDIKRLRRLRRSSLAKIVSLPCTDASTDRTTSSVLGVPVLPTPGVFDNLPAGRPFFSRWLALALPCLGAKY